MLLSYRSLEKAGYCVGTPTVTVQRPAGPLQVIPAAESKGTYVLPAESCDGTEQTLEISYRVEIQDPVRLFQPLTEGGARLRSEVGIGVRWLDKGSRIRGAVPFGVIQRGQGCTPWTVHGSAALPAQDLSQSVTVELVVYGGQDTIGASASVPFGTVLAVLRTDTFTLPRNPFESVQIAVPDPASSSPFAEKSLQLNADGFSIPIRRYSDPTGPLWQLDYKCSDMASDPVDEDHLCLVLNTANESYSDLAGPDFLASAAAEVRAEVLSTLLATALQAEPYFGLAAETDHRSGTIGELIRWIGNCYHLNEARTAADVAWRLRQPVASEASEPEAITWPTITRLEAHQTWKRWQNLTFPQLLGQVEKVAAAQTFLPEMSQTLRRSAEDLFEQLSWVPGHTTRGDAYAFDMEYALELHRTLAGYGFTAMHAAQDDIWRYLTTSALPDVVLKRIGKFTPKRLYAEPRRNYLRTLWWYAHLSLQYDETGQADYVAAYENMKPHTTDTIQQLVDRCGGGYPLDLYREIIRQLGQKTPEHNLGRDDLRKLLEHNVQISGTVEPALYKGGTQQYVRDLFALILPIDEADGGQGNSNSALAADCPGAEHPRDKDLLRSVLHKGTKTFGWRGPRWAELMQ